MIIYSSLHDRLKNQHETIEHIIARTDKSRITYVPEPGKWSIQDNIAHLAKYQPIFTDRIKVILEKDTPSFERYIAENDPEFESWRTKEISELTRIISADRKTLFDLIIKLPGQKLDRTGIHPRFGNLTVTEWVEFFLLHEAHHLFTIFQLANKSE